MAAPNDPVTPAPPAPDPTDDIAGHTKRLSAFLRWLLPIAVFFGTVEVLAFIPTGNVQVLLTGVFILVYSAAVVAAQVALRRGRLETGVRITAAGIVITAVSIAIVQPELWTPLTGIPFVAVGVALPTARGRGLIGLLLGAGLACGGIALLGALDLAPSHLPPWFLAIFTACATAAVATLVLILLFQFSDRLTNALAQSITANRALVATQAELEAERERLDTTLRSIGDGVIATDRAGRVVFVNPVAERLTGWPQAASIGQPIGAILDLRADDELEREESGPILVGRDGARRPIAHATAPILGVDGSTHGAVVVFRDVSDERRLTSERLEIDRRILENQKLESLATLAGGVAQQFNNLLVVIIGNAAIVRDELPAGTSDEPIAVALRDIESAAERAAVLARQMLAFSGRGRFVLGRVDVGAIIPETVAMLGDTLPPTVRVRYDLAASLPTIEADEMQIRQLLLVLLVNAAEAIGDRPGGITIRTRADTIEGVGGRIAGDADVDAGQLDGPIGDRPETPVVIIEVSDTGLGMDEATRRQVFQPFFSTKFVGRGLGLAGALGIVRGHLGRIDVRSTRGVGSTFSVMLPAREAPSRGAAAEPAEPSASLPRG